MLSYKQWFDKFGDNYITEYEDYLDTIDNTIIIPLELDEYLYDKYESSLGDYEDRKYSEHKDER